MDFPLDMPSLTHLIGLKNKSQVQLKTLYNMLQDYLKPCLLRLQINSYKEAIFLCSLLDQIQVPSFQNLPILDGFYILITGRIIKEQATQPVEICESPKRRGSHKKLTVTAQEIGKGMIIDKYNIEKSLVITDCYLLHLSQDSITSLSTKHELFLRQVRYFLKELFQCLDPDRQVISMIAAELPLLHYERNQQIIVQGQQCDAMFIVYTGEVQLQTQNNKLCSVKTNQFFNEDSTVCQYTAKVTSEQAQVFKMDRDIWLKLPDKCKAIIKNSKKDKSILRQNILEKHVITLKCPQLNNPISNDLLPNFSRTKTTFKKQLNLVILPQSRYQHKINTESSQNDDDQFEKITLQSPNNQANTNHYISSRISVRKKDISSNRIKFLSLLNPSQFNPLTISHMHISHELPLRIQKSCYVLPKFKSTETNT